LRRPTVLAFGVLERAEADFTLRVFIIEDGTSLVRIPRCPLGRVVTGFMVDLSGGKTMTDDELRLLGNDPTKAPALLAEIAIELRTIRCLHEDARERLDRMNQEVDAEAEANDEDLRSLLRSTVDELFAAWQELVENGNYVDTPRLMRARHALRRMADIP
jgi:hypothetical protein